MKKTVLILAILFISLNAAFAAKVDTASIFSQSMKVKIKCVVVLPDNYKSKKLKFPVVYLLHGCGDSFSAWVTKVPGIKKLADANEVIIVCPDGAYDSWYFDSPIDSTRRFETFVSTELPNYIDENFRTIANRKARAITGLSMGGHGAFFIALRHPKTFGACGSMSGGVDIRPFPNNWNIAKRIGDKKNYASNWEKYTVINVLDNYQPTDSLQIAFECGVEDFFIGVNRKLHEKLLTMKIPHDYTERPGGHNWVYWSNAIQYQMVFFKNCFKGN